MAILDFPAISPSAAEWGIEANTQKGVSPLNRVSQSLSLPGDRWVGSVTFDLLFGDNARLMRAFLGALRGTTGRFWYGPPDYFSPAGTAQGTPLAKGATGARSISLLTDGWTPNQTAALKAGDYIQVGNQLRMLISDAAANSSGEATLSLDAPLWQDVADNAAITVTNPKAIMALPSDQRMWQISSPVVYGFILSFVEALDI